MFKRILKIFSIVLLVAIAGVGVVVGVLFLQGKFKEPYVEPTSIYFDIENNTLDVTYYCNNLTTEGYTKSNVYSFVLKAKPSDVTELDCLMTTKSGSQLIEFCDKNGNPLNTNSLQSDIKIGERVYFKIKSSFDNTTENYANTNGEVKLEFISDNGLCNADLKIRIERQTSSVSLFDFNENTNNVHHNGKFDYEKVMYETIALTETPESWDGIFILDNSSGADVYLAVKEDAEWDATTVYYRAETKSDLEIEISANYEYELVPIYAPENSNKPFSNKDAKSTDIFIKNGDVFENIKDTSSNLIINRSGKYYFYSEQAGEFELYVISYPTYDYQQKFLDLELGSNENVIFNNPYAITRRVLVKVMNSGVQSVYFNDGNELLNINLDLFKENKLIVKNNSVVDGTINLNVNMFNSTSALVNSRYNQIEFLNNSHFVAGNINLYSSDGKQIIVRENVVNLSGFASAYNGTKNYQIEYESNSIRLTINSGDDQLNNIILLFNGAVEKNGLSRITFAGVENDESSWVCQNQIILINRTPFLNDNQTPGDSSDDTTEYKYSIGEFKVGSYLIFSNSSKNNVNNSFMISSSGYGKDKTFTIIPKEQLSEISLYMLVVNEDKTFVYTSQSAGISINYEETSLVADKLLDLKIKYYYEDVEGEDEQIVLSESSTIKVSDLVEFSEGTFNLPLMFVEASDAKVHTINQISYEKTYDGRAVKYCLVGTIDENGHFINEIIPKSNVIGEEEIYIMLLKYNYDTTSAEQIVDNILSKFKNQQSTSEAKVLNNIFYIGAPIEIGETTNQITNIITTSTGIDVYYNDSAENSYVTVTDLNLFYNINEAELYKFYNSPTDTIVANIKYTEKINSEDESSVMDFKINLGDEGDLTEISEGESFNVSINLEGASNNANVLKLIADYYDNLGVLGLNNYFSLKILMINESNQVVQTGNIIRVSQEEVVSYSIDNTTISKYFAINNMFVDFDAEIGDILIIDVSVLNDSLDTFENFKFKFLFEYLEESATSNEFKIKSTAVQGYQWVVGETNYSFEEYYLIYNILWDNSSSNYTYSASLVLKAEYDDYLSGGATPTTIIELPAGSSLEDSNILVNNIDVVNEGYNENEFDFTAVSNSNLISVLEAENENEYSLVLNGLGEVVITLINTTKTNVESSFKVLIETNAISFASKNAVNNIEANNFVLSQGFAGTNNIFDFAQTLNESSIDLFNLTINEQPIVSFRISNLTTGYVAVAKEDGFGVNVVESSNVSNIVVSLEYSSNRWQLIRQPNYVLTTLSFDLIAISLVGEVTTTINYLSPVKIEKNAECDLVNFDVIDYYLGTTLQLTSDMANSVETLFKLTDNTGDSATQFKIQYFDNEQWKDLTQTGYNLALNNNVESLTVGKVYDARIYYNDNKWTTFKFRVNYNLIVSVSNTDGTENSQTNPYEISWLDDGSARINLETSVLAYNYSNSTYYSYTNANVTKIDITSFVLNKENGVDATSDSVFEIVDEESTYKLKINKLESTSDKLYNLEFKLVANSVNEIVNVWVSVSSSYNITNNKDLPKLTAYKEATINLSEYFSLTGGEYLISKINSITLFDEDKTTVDENVEYSVNGTNLTLTYKKALGGVRYMQIEYIVSNGTNEFALTDHNLYEIEINPLTIVYNNTSVVAGEQTRLTSLFELIPWDIISYIEITPSSKFNMMGSNVITNSLDDLFITANVEGTNYASTIKIAIYYADNTSYTYNQTLEIVNPTYLVVDYDFDDLVLDVSDLTFGNEEISLGNSLNFDIILTNDSIDLSNKVSTILASDNSVMNNKYLARISLFDTINLDINSNINTSLSSSPIYINNTTIRINNIDNVGYIIFKLFDNDGTSCYYTLGVTPRQLDSENYNSVSEIRNSQTINKVVEDSEIIENIISKNQIANTSGISKTLLERNNIYFYLKSNDGVEITNSQINKPLNGLAINKVINPTAFIVNVVVETSFASYVYTCDFKIVIEPKVDVTLGTNVSTEPGKLFTYNANIKYEYESENKILVKDLVEVAGKEIDSISILNSKNDKAEDIDLTETLSKYETSILTIGADCITLNINTSYNIYFDLKVGYKDGFVIVIKITYQKWENLNKLRAYSLGWNGKTFDNSLKFAELIPNYNGTATAVRSDKANSLSGAISVINEYLVFNLFETKQTVELTITLDILGNPSYNFVITLNPSYNVGFSQGWAQENSASTVLEATKSKLDLTISNTYTQNGYIEFILKNNTDILNIKVASSNILGEIGFKTLDEISTTEYFSTNSLYTFGNSGSLNIEFIETASDINGILTISINEYETIEVFITISQTYTLESNYKIDHDYKMGDKTLNLDYETFEVKSSITIEEFITNLNTIENPVKINQNRLVFKTLIDGNVVADDTDNDKMIDIYKTLFLTAGKNKLQAEIYYETLSGLVIDSNLAYASVVGETIRFIDDGIIYLRLFNETGVDCYYKIIIQQPENFYSTIIYDEKVENENYLFTTLSELKTGVKIANIKFIPTNELYFNITALNVTNAQVDYRNGSFEDSSIKINWKVNDNFEIILSSSLDGTLEMTSFTINFITINGISSEITIYITDTKITYGNTVDNVVIAETIYANNMGISLNGTVNGNKRITVSNNGEEITTNSSGSKYRLKFIEAVNLTDGDNSVITVDETGYTFSLVGVPYDTEIILYYELYWDSDGDIEDENYGILIKEFDYKILVKNDISISMNNFNDNDINFEGNIYLANYDIVPEDLLDENGNEVKDENGNIISRKPIIVDLLNKTDNDELYRLEYIVYSSYNHNNGEPILNGEGGTASSYLKFELDTNYFENFKEEDVVVTPDGKLKFYKDTDGKIALRLTAQFSPRYSELFVINVKGSIKVQTKFGENEYDGGTDGYNSNTEVDIIATSLNDNNTAMIMLSQDIYDEGYKLVNKAIEEDLYYTYQYVIRKNLSEAIDWDNIEESESEIIEAGVGVNKKIRLPYVNLSQTEKYIVTYKINIEMPNKSIREVIVNYQVKNNLEISITEEYKSKTIAVVMQNPYVDFIDLFDGDLKFMVGNYVAIKTENKTYYFEVFKDTTTPYIELFSPLESVGGEELEDKTLFKNLLDFDMQIIDKTSKSVIYESTDWKLIPEIQIEAKNSKALSDIFSKVELGDELQDKQFVKVVNSVDSLNSLSVSDISKLGSGFNGNYNGEGNKFKLEKTITRGAQEYEIYSCEVIANGQVYEQSAIMYIILSSSNLFLEILDGNYYISKIVETRDEDLVLDLKNYVKIWNAETWLTLSGVSITGVSTGYSLASVSGTNLTITSEKLQSISTSTVTFSITATYTQGEVSISRDINVVLYLPTVSE